MPPKGDPSSMAVQYSKVPGVAPKGTGYKCGKYFSFQAASAACAEDVNCSGFEMLAGKPGCLINQGGADFSCKKDAFVYDKI